MSEYTELLKELRQQEEEIQFRSFPNDTAALYRPAGRDSRREGWQCQYKAHPGRPIFRLDLTSGGTLVGHAEHSPQVATQNRGSLFVAWRNNLRGRLPLYMVDSVYDELEPGDLPLINCFLHEPDSTQQLEER